MNRHTLFEDLGLAYLGPIDGHDITEVESALRRADRLGRPVVIDPSTGRPRLAGSASWTSVFAEEITAIGAERADVVCLTAAMRHPPAWVVSPRGSPTGCSMS